MAIMHWSAESAYLWYLSIFHEIKVYTEVSTPVSSETADKLFFQKKLATLRDAGRSYVANQFKKSLNYFLYPMK